MSETAALTSRNSLYNRDFYEWTQEQARLLKARRWSDLDIDNLVEEVDSVGRSNKQQVASRMAVILEHLLKWEYQPDKRKYGWRVTLREQRNALDLMIEDSPSLRDHPTTVLDRAYRLGRSRAIADTGLSEAMMPSTCPYSVEQIREGSFLPGLPAADDA